MPGATPTTPVPLLRAAMVPATCVPWPLSSAAGVPGLMQLVPLDGGEVGVGKVDPRVEHRDAGAAGGVRLGADHAADAADPGRHGPAARQGREAGGGERDVGLDERHPGDPASRVAWSELRFAAKPSSALE